MKQAFIKLALVLLCLYLSTAINGQGTVNFRIGQLNGNCGETICLPVTVTGFTNVNSANGSFNWDANKLKYEEINNVALPDFLDAANVNSTDVENGKLSFAWIDLTGITPTTIPAGEKLLDICFEVISVSSGNLAPVTMTDEPTFISLSQSGASPSDPSVELNYTTQSGSVNVLNGCSPSSLTCNDVVNVSVDPSSCDAHITADMILEGGPYDYSVMVVDPNYLDISDIGNETIVVVSNTSNNTACWGKVYLEDKTGNCDPTNQIAYDQVNIILDGETSMTITPEMVLYPHQNSSLFTISPNQVDTSDIGEVPFIVQDVVGNTDYGILNVCETGARIKSCKKMIATIQPNGLAEFSVDQACLDIDYSCSDKGWIPSFSNTSNQASSFTLGCSAAANAGGIVPGGYQVFLYTGSILVDSCANFLQVLDGAGNCNNVSSSLTCKANITVSANPWGCSADLTPQMALAGGPYNFSNLIISPESIMELNVATTYTVTDLVTNNQCWGIVTLIDKTPPVPITTQNITISLTVDPSNNILPAKLFADSVDNGSFDGCSEVGFSPEFWLFDCSHIGTQRITFGVWDDADGDGTPGSTLGDNFNSTWMEVEVEVKADINVSATLECPPTVYVDCSDDVNDPSITGVPTSSACASGFTYLDTPGFDANEDGDLEDTYIGDDGKIYTEDYSRSCGGNGLVSREWSLGNNSCVQMIAISTSSVPFAESLITWPTDEVVSCSPDGHPEPSWDYDGCDLIGYSLEVDTFFFEADACVKYLFSYTVLNWCTYNPNDPNTGGRWTHTTVVSLVDTTVPELNIPTDITLNCIGNDLSLGVSANDGCQTGSELKWEITLDVNSDFSIDYEWSSFVENDSAGSIWEDSNGNGIPDVLIGAGHDFDILSRNFTVSGETLGINIPSAANENGTHTLTWKVYDPCANVTTGTSTFTIDNTGAIDQVKPIPYCINSSTAIVGDDGFVELWAQDFNLGSRDNCTSDDNLRFTFSSVLPPSRCDENYDNQTDLQWYNGSFWFYESTTAISDASADCPLNNQGAYSNGGWDGQNFIDYSAEVHRWSSGFRSSAARYSLDDVDNNGFVQLDIYVWDAADNKDFCRVNVKLEEDEECNFTEADVNWPDPILTLTGGDLQVSLSPENLIAEFNLVEDQVYALIGCENGIVAYADNVISEAPIRKIIREWTVLNWLTAEVYTFNQIINLTASSTYICDFLPNTAMVGDCDSGHTLDDDVEWPADITIADHRITPSELIAFSGIPTKDASPIFYNEPDKYLYTYEDYFISIDNVFLTLERRWTVVRPSLGSTTWEYNQKVTINLSEFSEVVSVNTMTNRPMSKVNLTTLIQTDDAGIGMVNENEPINLSYDDTARNGINILDLVLIQQHILGIKSMNNNQILAADINNDNFTNGLDIVELRKVILNIYSEFPQNDTWTFYQQTSSLSQLSTRGNFLAIKTGDIDDTAILANEDLSYNPVTFSYEDILLNKGQTYEVPLVFNGADFQTWGMELAIDIDESAIAITDITSEKFESRVEYWVADGKLQIVIMSSDLLVNLDDLSEVLTIHIEAVENTTLGTSLSFSEDVSSLVLDSSYELYEVNPDIEGQLLDGTHELDGHLIKIYPNPATDYLLLDVPAQIRQSGQQVITLYDITGKEVLRSRKTRIDLGSLSTGVYSYKLQLGQNTYSDKLIIQK